MVAFCLDALAVSLDFNGKIYQKFDAKRVEGNKFYTVLYAVFNSRLGVSAARK